ncbi:TetR family transcriptional regulator [Nocardia sp. XZ_19_385]|uniref:TetR family transcriptional regulator n=1 Tax=Nocardia sp. XZ_19_385 TaxID=2769488 RepID=UPI0028150B76|nr:TetR family transcriptional regulator [Nocardia sp. XZ_19_385]
MAEAPNFQTEMRLLLRERMLDAARDVVCTEGWGAVNMSRIAKDVGISRPVLYKEIGTKQALADALIERELGAFLRGIADTLAAHPDPITGMTRAAEYTLRTGADNTLLKAVLSGRDSSDTTLLPALITEPEPVLGRALAALLPAMRERYELATISDADLESLIEILVRLTLSHLFQPLGPLDRTVAQIELVITRVFTALIEAAS